MSADQMIQALRNIGYPKADKIDPHSLAWAFENESTLPFLEWFCDSVSGNNVLTDEDLKEFKALQDSQSVLNGKHLDAAAAAVSVPEDHSETPYSDIEELTQSLEKMKNRKSTLRSRLNELSVQQMSMENKITQMEEVAEKEKLSLANAMEQAKQQSAKISEVLESISASMERLTALYKVPPTALSARTGDHQAVPQPFFISQADLKSYHAAEEKYSHDLTTFSRKQFFEGMADMSGQKEAARYDLLDVSSADESVEECQDKSFAEDCQEFTRLQQIFPQSECDRLSAFVNANKAMGAVREAKSLLHQIKSGHFPMSPADIIQLEHKAEKRIDAIQSESGPLVSSLMALIDELGGLQGMEVLTGNYDLKLKRQDYFIKKQEKVIEHLVNQRARSEFLLLLYGLEEKFHQDVHHLLLAVLETLKTQKSEWEDRMKDMDDPDLSNSRFDRSVVDIRDSSSFRLYQLTGNQPGEKKLLHLPLKINEERAKQLSAAVESAAISEQKEKEEWSNSISQLETCMSEREALLYAGSSTTRGKPSLSPHEIQETFSKLTSQLTRFKDQLQAIMSDVQNKKKALKGNLLENKKRELFALFHTDPERLKYFVNSLADSSSQSQA